MTMSTPIAKAVVCLIFVYVQTSVVCLFFVYVQTSTFTKGRIQRENLDVTMSTPIAKAVVCLDFVYVQTSTFTTGRIQRENLDVTMSTPIAKARLHKRKEPFALDVGLVVASSCTHLAHTCIELF